MALVGKIEEVPPAEILVFLAESMKTGKLSFTTGTQEGMIVFRDGKIIYAASSTIRETFGSIALTLQIVTREQLEEALRLQHRSREDKRLGEILVETGAMRSDDVQNVLVHQVSQVVREIFEWKSGYFRFRNLEIEGYGDVQVDAQDLVVGFPLDTRSVALDAAREQDEAGLRHEPAEEAVAEEAVDEEPTEQTTLNRIMAEVAGPALTAEILREIFTIAATSLARGVIFAVRDHSARGLAQFGLSEDIAPPNERVRKLLFPLDEYSLIATVARDGEIFRGEPDHVRANTQLIRALGGTWPADAVAIPLLVGGRVALVFYGDNQPRSEPVGSTEILEKALAVVGRHLEESQSSP